MYRPKCLVVSFFLYIFASWKYATDCLTYCFFTSNTMHFMKKYFILIVMALVAVLSSCTSNTKLALSVAMGNKECPFAVDDRTTCTSIVQDEDHNVVFNYLVDESLVGMSTHTMELDTALYNQMREGIVASFIGADADTREFINLIREGQVDIIVNFVGDLSAYAMTMRISYTEL